MVLFKLRNYQKSDLKDIVTLFNTTIQAINKKDYTEKQIEQWLQPTPDYEKWNQKFLSTHTLVAVLGNKIIGFGNISDSGYLDCLYVDKDWVGYGIGKNIVKSLIAYAVKAGAKKITVHSSITAKPFFESLGFKTIKQRNNYLNGVLLINYLMVNEEFL